MHFDDVKAALYPDTGRRRGLQLRAGIPAAATWSAASRPARSSGTEGFEQFSRPGPAALARAAGADVVRRRQPGLGALGGRARHELPDQQRGPGRGVNGLRRDPAVSDPGVPRPPIRTGQRPGVAGAGRDPDRQRDRAHSAPSTRPTSRPARRARPAPGAGADDVRPRPARDPRRRSPRRFTRTPVSARSREVAFALPFSFEPEDYVQILSDMAEKLGPALGWKPTWVGQPNEAAVPRP